MLKIDQKRELEFAFRTEPKRSGIAVRSLRYVPELNNLMRSCALTRCTISPDRYGLLGPSGCGKTTLLSCIVGRSRLDAGHIQLSVNKKKEIGYMPQVTYLFTMRALAYTAAISIHNRVTTFDRP